MPTSPPEASAASWRRGALSAFLLFHLLTMGASLGKKPELGAAIRVVTAPYERGLGIWQSWGMFGPNPPMGTSWMKAEGTTIDGAVVALPVLVGELPTDRVEGIYSRSFKVERNLFDKKNKALHKHFAHYLCRTQAEAGVEILSVRLWKERHMTPRPQRRRVTRVDGVQVHELAKVDCP